MPIASDNAAPFSRLSFVTWLAERHAGLKPLLDAHLANNEELLVHVLFGDVTRYYEKLCETGATAPAAALVSDLDAGLVRGDEDVDNVLHVSFLENLGHEKGRLAWELLTPRLKAGFDLIHGYTSNP